MLELQGVRHAYGGRAVLDVDALAIGRDERLAVVGPNGSGKSTLLRLLAFLEAPTAGTVRLDGEAVRSDRARRAARRRVTLVEQRPYLFRGTVRENVAFGLRARGAPAAEAARRADEALAELKARSLSGRDARALSEGEIQRVALARALAMEPAALLLDEPVSGADRAAQHALAAALAEVQARRPLAVVVVSHLLENAYRWADRLLALHEGRPSAVSPENLFRVDLQGGAPMQRVSLGPVAVEVVTDKGGPATLAIPPDEIVLSTEPLHSSARNVIHGRIVRVAEHGAAVRVTIDAGVELVALITRKSFEEMGLAVGGSAYASFKSVAVRVF
ncbi:MAG: ATP-binding cassette domain-containing protein [Gemmatimonadetes bacterium]|nr:ATP-binding cassette domain-containing protein [Gemmatimonadota bacterium]